MSDAPNPRSVPWPSESGVWATYPLQCHCAAIQWTITLSPPLLEKDAEGKGVYTALECDCTHCECKAIIACHAKMKNVHFTQGIVSLVYLYLALCCCCVPSFELIPVFLNWACCHHYVALLQYTDSRYRSTAPSTTVAQRRTRTGSVSSAAARWARI